MPQTKKKTYQEEFEEEVSRLEKQAVGMPIRKAAGDAAEKGPLPGIFDSLRNFADSPFSKSLLSIPSLMKLFLPEDSKKGARQLAETRVDFSKDSPEDQETTDNRTKAGKALLGGITELAALSPAGGPVKLAAGVGKLGQLAHFIGTVGSSPVTKLSLGALAAKNNFEAPVNDYGAIASSAAGAGIGQTLARVPALKKFIDIGRNSTPTMDTLKSGVPIAENVGADLVGQIFNGRPGYDQGQTIGAIIGGIPGAGMSKMARSAMQNAKRTPTVTAADIQRALAPEGPQLERPNTLHGMSSVEGALPNELETTTANKKLGDIAQGMMGENADLVFDRTVPRTFDPAKAQQMVNDGLEASVRSKFLKVIEQTGSTLSPDSKEYKELFSKFRTQILPQLKKIEGPKLLNDALVDYTGKVDQQRKAFQQTTSQYSEPVIGLTEFDSQGRKTGVPKEISDALTQQKTSSKYVKIGEDGKIYTKTDAEFNQLKPEQRSVWNKVDEIGEQVTIKQGELNKLVRNAQNSQGGVKITEKRFNEFLQTNPYYQKGFAKAIKESAQWNPEVRRTIAATALKISDSESLAKAVFEPKEFDTLNYIMYKDPQMRPLIKGQISKGMSELTGEWKDILQQANSGKVIENAPLDKFKASIGGTPERIQAFNDLYENPKAYENMTNLLEAHKKSLEVISRKKFDPKMKSLVFPTMFLMVAGVKSGVIPASMAEMAGFAAAGVTGAVLHQRGAGTQIMEKVLQDQSGRLGKSLARYWKDPVANARIGASLGRIFAQWLPKNTAPKED